MDDEVQVSVRTEVHVLDSALGDEGERSDAYRCPWRCARRTFEADDTTAIHISDVEVAIRPDAKAGDEADAGGRVVQHGTEVHACRADAPDVAVAEMRDVPVAILAEFDGIRNIAKVCIALAEAVSEALNERSGVETGGCIEGLDAVRLRGGDVDAGRDIEEAEIDREFVITTTARARLIRSGQRDDRTVNVATIHLMTVVIVVDAVVIEGCDAAGERLCGRRRRNAHVNRHGWQTVEEIGAATCGRGALQHGVVRAADAAVRARRPEFDAHTVDTRLPGITQSVVVVVLPDQIAHAHAAEEAEIDGVIGVVVAILDHRFVTFVQRDDRREDGGAGTTWLAGGVVVIVDAVVCIHRITAGNVQRRRHEQTQEVGAGLQIIEVILADRTGGGGAQHEVTVRPRATDGQISTGIPEFDGHILDAGLAHVVEAVEVRILIDQVAKAEALHEQRVGLGGGAVVGIRHTDREAGSAIHERRAGEHPASGKREPGRRRACDHAPCVGTGAIGGGQGLGVRRAVVGIWQRRWRDADGGAVHRQRVKAGGNAVEGVTRFHSEGRRHRPRRCAGNDAVRGEGQAVRQRATDDAPDIRSAAAHGIQGGGVSAADDRIRQRRRRDHEVRAKHRDAVGLGARRTIGIQRLNGEGVEARSRRGASRNDAAGRDRDAGGQIPCQPAEGVGGRAARGGDLLEVGHEARGILQSRRQDGDRRIVHREGVALHRRTTV